MFTHRKKKKVQLEFCCLCNYSARARWEERQVCVIHKLETHSPKGADRSWLATVQCQEQEPISAVQPPISEHNCYCFGGSGQIFILLKDCEISSSLCNLPGHQGAGHMVSADAGAAHLIPRIPALSVQRKGLFYPAGGGPRGSALPPPTPRTQPAIFNSVSPGLSYCLHYCL